MAAVAGPDEQQLLGLVHGQEEGQGVEVAAEARQGQAEAASKGFAAAAGVENRSQGLPGKPWMMKQLAFLPCATWRCGTWERPKYVTPCRVAAFPASHHACVPRLLCAGGDGQQRGLLDVCGQLGAGCGRAAGASADPLAGLAEAPAAPSDSAGEQAAQADDSAVEKITGAFAQLAFD